jgi:hypothetical protein
MCRLINSKNSYSLAICKKKNKKKRVKIVEKELDKQEKKEEKKNHKNFQIQKEEDKL